MKKLTLIVVAMYFVLSGSEINMKAGWNVSGQFVAKSTKKETKATEYLVTNDLFKIGADLEYAVLPDKSENKKEDKCEICSVV